MLLMLDGGEASPALVAEIIEEMNRTEAGEMSLAVLRAGSTLEKFYRAVERYPEEFRGTKVEEPLALLKKYIENEGVLLSQLGTSEDHIRQIVAAKVGN